MRQSKIFSKTTKTMPADIKLASHKFLYKAGFIRESAAGRYYFLPIGIRVREKIAKIVEEEMNRAGAIKIITPVLHPLDLWKETNRTQSVGFELMIVKDRNNSEFALGGTAEEMMVDLVRKFSLSYRDLPFNIYQFSQKFRDEMRARGGLLRVREFMMKDAYSFHADEDDFKKEYQNMWEAYKNIFNRLGLATVVVEADNGYIGGEYCHEFVVESDAGESRFLISADGAYAAHEDVAQFEKKCMNLEEKLTDLKEVDAQRGNTMEDGVDFHQLPLWQQIKDVLFVNEKGEFILAIIRGDFDVNKTKLKNLTKSVDLRHATDEEIRGLGSEPGFISPVGIDKKVIVVADDSLRTIKNAYGGANKKNKDLLNINIDRDYQPNLEGDIAMAQDGFLSEGGSRLQESKGIEVGNIFQLGYHYSSKMNAKFTDADGKEKFYYMGCYGIGIDRTLATIAEKYHDDKGIIWPESVAPFKIHLIGIGNQESGAWDKAEELYKILEQAGMEVLFDDRRDITAGEKFADADLIGCPYRLVVSEKTLAKNSVEVKKRNEDKAELVEIGEVIKYITHST
ncbi:MAG: proline--tRNA ligase [Patescibacteria group bacterium]|nr:proline--tRNA ligase [Patescibacteria group bacterium]MDD4610791.1 proline--tRNA ligase [Patescibacteria group bacterium]